MSNYAITQQAVVINALDVDERNANVMTDKDVATLATAIGKFGALQPILVATNGATPGRYRIVDGHHRSRAATLAGRDEIEAVVLPPDYPLEDERMLRISMNRLRGELDLGAVSEVLAEMVASGQTREDLLLTGYSSDEIAALLRAATAEDIEDDLMGQHIDLPEKDAPEPKPFVIEIEFDSKADMTKAKRALKRAAAGASLGTGLLSLIEGS